MRNWGTAEDCWHGTGERGWFAPHCHEPLWATIPQALLGKGDCFSRVFFAPPHRHHHPTLDAEAGRKHARSCLLFTQFWQRASQPKHTQISRRGLDPSALFALLPAARQAATLLLAPCTQLWEAPEVAPSPIQAPTVVLLRALWCSCCFPAWGIGEYKLFLPPARMPRAHAGAAWLG